MNLSRTDIADNIEAYYDGNKPTAQDVSERISYLIKQLEEAVEESADVIIPEREYAIGDTINLLNLIKSKLNG
jgi:hypothetical protein